MLDSIRSLKAYRSLLEDLRAGLPLPGLALMRSARIPLAESLREDLQRPVFLITDRADHALYWFDELSFWAKDLPVYLFPEPTPLFYEPAAWGAQVRRDRIQVLTLLAKYAIPGVPKPEIPPLIVAPIRAVMTRTLSRREFLKASKPIRQGQTISLEQLKRWWVQIGYQSMDTVLEPGQFSHRGGILDIWPPAEAYPVRLEFFGDEIETLRTFDPATQRKIQPIQSVLITPAREVLPGKASELNLSLQDLDEFYLPVVHSTPASVLEFLPQNVLIILDDLDLLQTFSNEIEEQAIKTRHDSLAEGILEKDFPVPYISFSEIREILSAYPWIELGRGTATENSPLAEAFQPGPRFGGRLKSFVDFLLSGCADRQKFFILSRQVGRIREVWQEQTEQNPVSCQPEFLEGTLSEGWVLTLDDGQQVYLFTDSEIFGWDRPQPRGRARQAVYAPESEYTDFKVGDYIVHVDYGIGRFAGLSRRTVDGIEREYLAIEYEGGDTIFVPVYQADRLTRYIGPSGETPSLTHLGGSEWASVKQRVRESVLEVA
ncbi:CarD family transcriptional regulator, partial [Anaerolinea sp.]